jgi:transcriptional regulator with XRE-family HTH domain
MQGRLNPGMARPPETLGQRLRLAREMRGLTQPQLARLAGVGQTAISKLERGDTQKSPGIARLADSLSVSARWLELGIGPTPDWGSTEAPTKGVAQSLSYLQPIVTPRLMTWEEMMDGPLPEAFALTLRDDALAPDYPKGCVMRFEKSRAPEAGRPVLITDADGEAYIRVYVVGRGTNWQAVATNRHYQSWDAQADGLQVLAAFTGFDLPTEN